MRGRPVADAGSGGSPCPAGRDDAVSEARANTACLDLHVPRLGEEPKKEGPHGAGLLPGVPRADYQIRTRWSSGRTIGSPALQPNASANTGMFDGAPIARNFAGACGSVLSRTSCALSRMLPRQTRAQLRKRSEEHTSELQSLMRISYAVFCLKK